MTAVHLINRLSTTLLKGKSPYEVLHKEEPTYDHLRVFGCLAVSYNNTPSTDKFAARGITCVFVGYPPHKKGYRLINLSIMTEFISRDVKFFEDIFPFSSEANSRYMQPVTDTIPPLDNSSYSDLFDDLLLIDAPQPASPSTDQTESNDMQGDGVPQETSIPLRRSTRHHRPPQWQQDYLTTNTSQPVANLANTSVHANFNCLLATLTATHDPISFKEAVQYPHWVSAMNAELEALERNGTWSAVNGYLKLNSTQMEALKDTNHDWLSWGAGKSLVRTIKKPLLRSRK